MSNIKPKIMIADEAMARSHGSALASAAKKRKQSSGHQDVAEMLNAGQPTTSASASPQTTPALKDASTFANKKQKVAEGLSSSIEISLPAGVTTFNDYKSLIRGAD
ncbi:hypothetical protein ACOSQ4_018984 [Xanthoceras sorbifolium]